MQLFVTGFLLSLSLSLDLGTVNVAMVRTALQHGARPSFLLGLGSCLGDLAYALISLLAVAALLQSLAVRWALWLAGTLILLFLAAKMLREALGSRPDNLATPEGTLLTRSAAGYLLQGIGLAMSSPSAILWFATVGDGTASDGHQGVLLEFGHVGVWALLAAALVVAAVVGRWQRISSIFALGALLLYATFLVALLTN